VNSTVHPPWGWVKKLNWLAETKKDGTVKREQFETRWDFARRRPIGGKKFSTYWNQRMSSGGGKKSCKEVFRKSKS